MLHDDRRRAEGFGAIAAIYDRARPSYPAALVDWLLAGGARAVLDVGCGTGIAAALFAARGCRVLGVEVDERMAAVARAKGLEVEVARFEQWRDRGRRFDLLTCAQAWHWIEPRAGTERAAAVLRAGGRIALFWNFGEPAGALRARLDAVYEQFAPELDTHAALRGQSDRRVREAAASLRASQPHFGEPDVLRFPWQHSWTTRGWLEHLSTHSDHLTLAPARRERLLAEVERAIDAGGGEVPMHYEAVLVTARRA